MLKETGNKPEQVNTVAADVLRGIRHPSKSQTGLASDFTGHGEEKLQVQVNFVGKSNIQQQKGESSSLHFKRLTANKRF